MAVGAIIAIVIVIVLLAAVAGAVLLRRRALRRRFGPEYDRLAQEVGERRAVSELSERQRRIAQLDIHPLSAERRASYISQWETMQGQFVDAPARTAEAAGALVTAVAADRGYQVVEQEQLLTDLSVYHADQIEGYRQARQTTEHAGTAATEDLRQAMLGYRALLLELFETPDGASEAATPEPATSATPVPSRTPQPDDAAETETGTRSDIAAETGARARVGTPDVDDPEALDVDDPEAPDGLEAPLDDRSAAQATRKE